MYLIEHSFLRIVSFATRITLIDLFYWELKNFRHYEFIWICSSFTLEGRLMSQFF